MNLYHFGVVAALVAFACSSIFFLQSFVTSPRRQLWQKLAYGFFWTSTVLMTVNTFAVFHLKPDQLFSSFVLITSVCWLSIIAKLVFDFRMLGALVAPFAMLIILLQFLFFPPHAPSLETAPSLLMYVHIFTSLLGEAFAIIATVVATFYLMQQRALKKRQVDKLAATQMPINKLYGALGASLWAGFVLLTLGLILGAVYMQFYVVGDRESLTGKIIWAFLVWVWYLAILVSRNLVNISAKKLAWMTIAGFGLLALGMFGTNNWSTILG